MRLHRLPRTREIVKEPRSQLCRYAFGYSDQKPHWSFWLLIAAMIAFVLFNVFTISPAAAVECRASKGAGHPWAWRQIDGKRCWYKGKAGMDKKKLRWPKPSTVGLARPKPLIPVAPPNDPLLQSYWPPLDKFDERFKGALPR